MEKERQRTQAQRQQRTASQDNLTQETDGVPAVTDLQI